MSAPCRTPRLARAAARVALQLGVGLAAHTLAHGCPPGLASLAALLPAAAVAVGATELALSRRRAPVRLAGGQVAVHLVLSALVVCTPAATHAGAHAHPGAGPASLPVALMLLAHAAATLVCLSQLERVERAAAAVAAGASAAVARLVPRLRTIPSPTLPALPGHAAPDAVLPLPPLLSCAPLRGPPVAAR